MEHEQLQAAGASAGLGALESREQQARESNEALQQELQGSLAQLQALRTRQHETDSDLERARGERDRARSELMSAGCAAEGGIGRGRS